MIFDRIIDLHEAMHLPPMNQMQGKTWIHDLPDSWQFALNANKIHVDLKPKGSMGCKVPPFNAAFFFNGWLAGLADPEHDTLAAGDIANRNTLNAAFDKAIEALKQ